MRSRADGAAVPVAERRRRAPRPPAEAALHFGAMLVAGILGFSAGLSIAGDGAGRRLLAAADAAQADTAVQHALERTVSHTRTRWVSRATRVAGEVTPLRTWQAQNGLFCREYTEQIETTQGIFLEQRIACRTAGGRWTDAE